MVGRILLLLSATLASLAIACSGDDKAPSSGSPNPGSEVRPTSAPTRPASGPTAAVDPRSGPPGSEITVTGSGWPAGVLVDLTGSVPAGVKAPPYATVVTDGSGGFTAHFRLETAADGAELKVGRYDLIARTSTAQVDIPFLVETRRPIRNPGPGG
jgi:hypothetical protein